MAAKKDNGVLPFQVPKKPRIVISSDIQLQMVQGIMYSLSTYELKDKAWSALKAIQNRSTMEILPKVMLAANALLHIQEIEDKAE
jgi:hypothetical protein